MPTVFDRVRSSTEAVKDAAQPLNQSPLGGKVAVGGGEGGEARRGEGERGERIRLLSRKMATASGARNGQKINK